MMAQIFVTGAVTVLLLLITGGTLASEPHPVYDQEAYMWRKIYIWMLPLLVAAYIIGMNYVWTVWTP